MNALPTNSPPPPIPPINLNNNTPAKWRGDSTVTTIRAHHRHRQVRRLLRAPTIPTPAAHPVQLGVVLPHHLAGEEGARAEHAHGVLLSITR
jgi:hypothetical protein